MAKTAATPTVSDEKAARQKARVADTIRRMPDILGREDPALIAAMTAKK